MLAPEAVIAMINALAATIAKGRTNEELALLAAVFSQLGDTLATIATVRDIASDNKAEKDQETEKKEEN